MVETGHLTRWTMGLTLASFFSLRTTLFLSSSLLPSEINTQNHFNALRSATFYHNDNSGVIHGCAWLGSAKCP
jgi:hypothetical protein